MLSSIRWQVDRLNYQELGDGKVWEDNMAIKDGSQTWMAQVPSSLYQRRELSHAPFPQPLNRMTDAERDALVLAVSRASQIMSEMT